MNDSAPISVSFDDKMNCTVSFDRGQSMTLTPDEFSQFMQEMLGEVVGAVGRALASGEIGRAEAAELLSKVA